MKPAFCWNNYSNSTGMPGETDETINESCEFLLKEPFNNSNNFREINYVN